MHGNDELKAYAAGTLFALFTGLSLLGIKLALMSGTSIEVLLYRYDFAGIGALILLFAIRKRPKDPGFRFSDLLFTALFYVLFMALQTVGLVYCSSVVSAIIFAMVPALVAFLAWIFLKEKMNTTQVFSVIICMIAVITLVAWDSSDVSFSIIGILFLLASSMAMALYSLLLRSNRNAFTPSHISVTTSLMGAVMFNIWYIVSCIKNNESIDYLQHITDAGFMISTAYLGVVCILITAVLAAFTQAKLPAARATAFSNISTLISILAGAIVLGEDIKLHHIVCGAVIVGSVITLNTVKKAKHKG